MLDLFREPETDCHSVFLSTAELQAHPLLQPSHLEAIKRDRKCAASLEEFENCFARLPEIEDRTFPPPEENSEEFNHPSFWGLPAGALRTVRSDAAVRKRF
jgi:hypothetical protein